MLAMHVDPQTQEGDLDLKTLLERYERRLIEVALAESGGRLRRAAGRLGVGPSSLHDKMKRLGVQRPGEASGEEPAVVLARGRNEFRWRGRPASGAAIEVKGALTRVRALPAVGPDVELVARRGDDGSAEQVAIAILEHRLGVTFSVYAPRADPSILRLPLTLDVHVPDDLRLDVQLAAGDVELAGGMDAVATTRSGVVRVASRTGTGHE